MRTKVLSCEELNVLRGDTHVATLTREKSGVSLQFHSQVDTSMPPGIGFSLPPTDSTMYWQGDSLPPFFANMLPEGQRIIALFRALRTSLDDLFSALAVTGSTAVGDVQIAPIEGVNLATIDLRGESDWTWTEVASNAGFAVANQFSGAMSKMSAARLTHIGNIGSVAGESIIKFPHNSYPNLAENEHIVMQSLKSIGIRPAKTEVIRDTQGVTGLAVRRFDFLKGKKLRFHLEDALQLMDRYPKDKYVVSWRLVCESVLGVCSAPIPSALRLMKEYAYAYLIGNSDMHAKNISVITDPISGITQQSQAYDWLCPLVYRDSSDPSMALQLDGKDDNLRLKDLLSFGRRVGVDEDLFMLEADNFIEVAQDTWSKLLALPWDDRDDRLCLERAEQTLVARWKRWR
ncbi:MAG: type II toxin-antitoxin system HipA family toxin [Fimbriimonadaceae bacterium]|nr:type II toxin-antitoxin system HipA family toxin [Fimbriimonadaceae bacterium]